MERDYVREEWVRWQNVVAELALLGIDPRTLNEKGDALIKALEDWSFARVRIGIKVVPK